MSLSFISAFREFEGEQDRIQQSCMYSWKANGIKVFVPINEEGIKEKCGEDITLVGGVQTGRDLGFNNRCPVVKDLILKALPLIETETVALINSDIIIDQDFSVKVKEIFNKYGQDIFMVGARKDIDLKIFINTRETYLQVLSQEREIHNPSTSSDIFIASKAIWLRIANEMPPFLLGRFCWDNWLHLYAMENNLRKYNCSNALLLLHCEHGYRHIEIQENAGEGDAASTQYNVELFGKRVAPNILKWPRIELYEKN